MFELNRIDHALAFRLAVRMGTSVLSSTKLHFLSLFCYPVVIETNICFRDFLSTLRSAYPWSDADAVELSHFSSTEQRFLPLTCDEHLGLLFYSECWLAFR